MKILPRKNGASFPTGPTTTFPVTAALQVNQTGYHIIILCRHGTPHTFTVHGLVANVFIGPRPIGSQVNHRDFDRTNNHVTNLEYVTPRENIHHTMNAGRTASGDRHGSHTHPERVARGDRHGRYTKPERTVRGDDDYSRLEPQRLARGERNGCAKLTTDEVLTIRSLAEGGTTFTALGKQFSVSRSAIALIVYRKKWAHI